MTVDPKRLRELLMISRTGTFTEAAKQLYVSQPALSNSIRVLEQQLGVRLLDRNRKGATTTEYGELLLGYARALETLLSRAAEDVSRRRSGHSGTLIVGVTPIAAGDIVPAVVSKLITESPDLWVRIDEDVDDRLLDKLATGSIDLMVGPIETSPHNPNIAEIPLFKDEFHIVLRPDHPLAARKSLSLSQLADAYWVMPEIGTVSRRQMEALFAEAGLPWPSQVIRSNSVAAIKEIVACTDSVSFISPRLVRSEVAAGILKCVEPRGTKYVRTIGVRRSRDIEQTPAVRRFLGILAELAKVR